MTWNDAFLRSSQSDLEKRPPAIAIKIMPARLRDLDLVPIRLFSRHDCTSRRQRADAITDFRIGLLNQRQPYLATLTFRSSATLAMTA
jgi:hypothetical protein